MSEGTTNKLEVGDEMEDGTILAGYYEGRPLYATPRDAPGDYKINEAIEYARNLDAHGHHDFRPPTEDELHVLDINHNTGKLKGTFNVESQGKSYWGASPGGWIAYTENFKDGWQGGGAINTWMAAWRNRTHYLRCVRSDAPGPA